MNAVTGAWTELGVAPKTLADSGKTVAERERVAAAIIERYMDALLQNRARFVEIPGPLETMLREKYDWKLNTAGLSRATERAQRVRVALDSARAAERPPTQVPIQPTPQQGAQPQGAQPQ